MDYPPPFGGLTEAAPAPTTGGGALDLYRVALLPGQKAGDIAEAATLLALTPVAGVDTATPVSRGVGWLAKWSVWVITFGALLLLLIMAARVLYTTAKLAFAAIGRESMDAGASAASTASTASIVGRNYLAAYKKAGFYAHAPKSAFFPEREVKAEAFFSENDVKSHFFSESEAKRQFFGERDVKSTLIINPRLARAENMVSDPRVNALLGEAPREGMISDPRVNALMGTGERMVSDPRVNALLGAEHLSPKPRKLGKRRFESPAAAKCAMRAEKFASYVSAHDPAYTSGILTGSRNQGDPSASGAEAEARAFEVLGAF